MSVFHQVIAELIAGGLKSTVAQEGDSIGLTWGPSPTWLIAETSFWPDGGLSAIGLFTARALAIKSNCWALRS